MSRLGTGDAMIGLAVIVLVLAALLPSYRARTFDHLVEDAVSDVDALRRATTMTRTSSGRWPAATPPGRPPEGSFGTFNGEAGLVRDGYTLEWRVWERVEEVVAPPRLPAPPVLAPDEGPLTAGVVDAPPDSAAAEMMEVVRTEGAVVVHAGDSLLLAALLRRYPDDVSFVRDTTWTLLVTAAPSGG